MHPASLPIEDLMKSCQVRTLRRSGPGGQNRNKVETGVVIEHTTTGIKAEATERRSQAENKRVAIFRIRLQLALQYRLEGTVPIRSPSELWCQRRNGQRIAVSSEHEDFPTLMAEVLDHLNCHHWNLGEVADHLGVTTSQLVKLLRGYPPSLELVNRQRLALNLAPLR